MGGKRGIEPHHYNILCEVADQHRAINTQNLPYFDL